MEQTLSFSQIMDYFAVEVIVFIPKFLLGLAIFLLFWLAGVATKRFVTRVKLKGETSEDLKNLVRQTLGVTFLVVGAATALGTMGMDVTAIVAGLGLTGFAIGFALRDVLSNVVSGALIIFYRPFRRGDKIQVMGNEGVVKEIDLRYTSIESEGKRILIPNSQLFNNAVSVFADRDK